MTGQRLVFGGRGSNAHMYGPFSIQQPAVSSSAEQLPPDVGVLVSYGCRTEGADFQRIVSGAQAMWAKESATQPAAVARKMTSFATPSTRGSPVPASSVSSGA
jgi:hypothetical protein